ncbi:MAG: hypothetical protein LBT08_03755 [Synergistaceae bacterium]|jgi:hypothetical protein|nr:hypothetical protein [Synergistaceae bacterium]
MATLLAEVKRKLSRIFLGRIVVRELGSLRRETPVTTSTHRRTAEVIPMRAESRVGSALFVKWKQTRAIDAGSFLGLSLKKNFKIHRIEPVLQKPAKVQRYKMRLKSRAAAKNALKRVKKYPISRKNRINFLKKQMKFEKGTLLALYSPIFQEKVSKSALDKGSGNLYIWYDNERVKSGERYHLLLLRVFGGEEPLKWVWLPANKKLS